MTENTNKDFKLTDAKRLLVVALAIIFGFVPVLLVNYTANAAQITSRSLLMSSGQASATANMTFTFTPAVTTQIQSMIFQACTTPLGSCTAPAGINMQGTITKGGTWGGATNFTV